MWALEVIHFPNQLRFPAVFSLTLFHAIFFTFKTYLGFNKVPMSKIRLSFHYLYGPQEERFIWSKKYLYSVYYEEPQTELGFPYCVSFLYTIWVTKSKKTRVSSFYQWTEACTIWIPHLHKLGYWVGNVTAQKIHFFNMTFSLILYQTVLSIKPQSLLIKGTKLLLN